MHNVKVVVKDDTFSSSYYFYFDGKEGLWCENFKDDAESAMIVLDKLNIPFTTYEAFFIHEDEEGYDEYDYDFPEDFDKFEGSVWKLVEIERHY